MAIKFLNTVQVDTDVLYVDAANDRVGIGTTGPSQKLHLQNGILLVDSNTPVSTGIWMPDTSGNPSLRIVTDQSSAANSSIINAWGNSSNAGVVVGSTRNDGFAFQVRSGVTLTDGFANDTGNSRMVVLGNGSVGIGTTSPTSPLTIKSNSISSSSSGLTIQANGNTNDIFQLGEKSTDGSRLQMLDAGVVKIALYSDGTDNYINAGNVGIGTTSPATKLHVSGGDIRVDDTKRIQFGAGGVAINNDAIGRMYFNAPLGYYWQAGSNYRMVLNSSGNVGIGTTSPNRALQVIGTDGVAKFYYNSSFTNAQYSVVDVGMMTSGTAANGFGPKITFRMGENGYDGYATGTIGTIRNGADNTHNLNFGTSNSGSMTTKMTITNAGNVGIGTESPSTKLHVVGTLRAGGSSDYIELNSNGNIMLADSNCAIGPIYTGSPSNTLNIGFTMTGVWQTINHYAGEVVWNPGVFGNMDGMNLSNTGDLLIKGDVGIGTTAPLEKLQVAGNAAIYGAIKGYTGSSSNQYLSILQSGSLTYISTGTTNETIYFGIGPVANTTNINCTGTATATNFILSSDKRLKKNIKDLKPKKLDVKWKSFELKLEPEYKRVGVIAQELEKTNPEFVREDVDGTKSVAYIDLLITKIVELEARLEKAGL